MDSSLAITIASWRNADRIPDLHAFCIPAPTGHITTGPNISPAISWTNAPAGTASFALVCHDPDVPTTPELVNVEGKTIAADLPRTDFYHHVLVDIPPHLTALDEGVESTGIEAGGKVAGKFAHGRRGLNNYTEWFAGDPDMRGDYAGYDGPCPPWNDERLHHYYFTLYALDIPALDLPANFTGTDAIKAMHGHILASDTWVGTYTLNPSLIEKEHQI